MAFKAVIALSASVLLAQSVLGQCLGRGGSYNTGLDGVGLGSGCNTGLGDCGAGLTGYSVCLYGYGAGLGGYGAGLAGCGYNSGGWLAVFSASPVSPMGVTVLSENMYESQLCVGVNLPFLGSVGIKGLLTTSRAGAVSYGCGDGAIILSSVLLVPLAFSSEYFVPSIGLVNQGISGYGVDSCPEVDVYSLGAIGDGLGVRCGCVIT